MSIDIKEFLKDEQKQSYTFLREKYFDGKNQDTTIGNCVDQILERNLKGLIVDSKWTAESEDRFGYKCVPKGLIYEVFYYERESKTWLNLYTSLGGAAFGKLDMIFNVLGFAAPDSIINSPTKTKKLKNYLEMYKRYPGVRLIKKLFS